LDLNEMMMKSALY